MTKVRIYDLSRELNLDNKQVLAICNELNIAAKTHSSTIPEEDAERIRANADKLAPAKPQKRKGKGNKKNGQKSSKSQQQILEVKHNKSRSETTSSESKQQGSGQSPQLIGPPRPVRSDKHSTESTPQQSDTPKQPNMKNESEADKSSASVSPDSDYDSGKQQTAPPKTEAAKPSEPQTVEAPQSASSEQSSSSSKTESSSKSQLIGPPAKPKPPKKPEEKNTEQKKDNKKGEQSKKTEKPTLKSGNQKPKPKRAPEKTKAEKSQATESETSSKEPASAKQQQEPKKPAKPKMLEKPKRGTDKKAAPKQEPAAKNIEEDTSQQQDTSDDQQQYPLESPRRPRPKRGEPPHRHSKKKNWEEQEEQTEKDPSKSTNKKRRPKPVIEEDDDEQDLAIENEKVEDQPEQSTAMRSLERPPKPESLQKSSSQKTPSPSKPTKAKGSSSQKQRRQRQQEKEQKQRPEKITLHEELPVWELAERLVASETEIIKNLFFRGIAANITQTLDLETARSVAQDLGVEVEIPEQKSAAEKTEMLDSEDLENLQPRPPVVTIMGHVDHGKTSLLDSIRQTKVTEQEAGGITQHTGSYHVDVDHDGETKQVVFLDTPGHEAFTAMRARGAKVTDIAILVVAADDGVQPQTKEAISHAQAAGVPIVVAINKMDKEGAQPDRVKQELTEHGLLPEEWGGQTPMVGVSAITGDNLDELLEMIILVAELEELSANPDRSAKGTVVEAHLDRTRGPVANLLVQNGTLRVGDAIVAGGCFGKVRAMVDDRGEGVEAASPSFAVEVLGLGDVPSAGDEFVVYEDERQAREVAEQISEQMRNSRLQRAARTRRISLSGVSEQAQEGELKELNLIIKADVQGSVEAIQSALEQLPQNEVQIRVLLGAPGEVTETDVDLAAASGAIIIGFNTTLASNAKAAADQEGVDIREYDIIYKLLDDIQGAMEGLLEPEEVESPLGQAEVRAVFPVGRGYAGGCYVQSGRLVRNRRMRVRRNGEVVYDGNMDSLKRVKDDVKEVQAGFECGVGANKFHDWQEGDIIEAYEMVLKRRKLSDKK